MSFYGLEIAKSAIFISQQAVNLAGHNIANASTAGYTRQRVTAVALDAADFSGRYAPLQKGGVGAGAHIKAVDQLRNAYIDRALRQEYSDMGRFSTRTDELEYIEAIFNEVRGRGISGTLSEFFDSIQEFSKDPVSKEIRTNVQQNALKLTESFNHYYKQLSEHQAVMNESLKMASLHVTGILSTIAAYNKSIYSYELGGEKANDMRDKRNLLLDELSEYLDIEYHEDSSAKLTISAGGDLLVSHTDFFALTAVADQQGVVTGTPDFYRLCIEGTDDGTGSPIELKYTSGRLYAYKELRDGNSPTDIGIPHLLTSLNKLVRGLAEAFNSVHEDGYTIPHGAVASETGVRMFEVPLDTFGQPDYSALNAGNFRLSPDVINDVYKFAGSSNFIDNSTNSPELGNNLNALRLAALTNAENMLEGAGFEGFLKGAVLELAIESSRSQSIFTGQQAVVGNLETRRESISGVSVDEEMVVMMRYQHMFAAASRVINAIDEALEKLINGTGLVGR